MPPKKKSSIHIKAANKGKFTAKAKKEGRSVQAEASHVLADPKASKTQKKRAQFAKNAKSWHHG